MNESLLPNLSDGVIFLHPLVHQDAAEHLAGQDVEQARWLDGGKLSTTHTVERAIERHQEQWRTGGPIRNFGVWDQATGLLLGHVEVKLRWVNWDAGLAEADVSYGLFPAARGRGCAARAVRLVCDYLRGLRVVRKAVIRVDPENLRSKSVARRAGFRFTGVVDGPEERLEKWTLYL